MTKTNMDCVIVSWTKMGIGILRKFYILTSIGFSTLGKVYRLTSTKKRKAHYH